MSATYDKVVKYVNNMLQELKASLIAIALKEDNDENYLASKLGEALTKWMIVETIHVGMRDNAAKKRKKMTIWMYVPRIAIDSA
ncbi:hypothetical protein ACJMK2_042017 [Sinanodonta woodiana]|uniref:Uncharacterized protein n=1 Tax=Sinanodonta woodiana TaxID=1069815 RepID=A0ABD3W9B3_SINWO